MSVDPFTLPFRANRIALLELDPPSASLLLRPRIAWPGSCRGLVATLVSIHKKCTNYTKSLIIFASLGETLMPQVQRIRVYRQP